MLFQIIYRTIYRDQFDDSPISHGKRGVVRKLRYRGKTQHSKVIRKTNRIQRAL